MNVEEEVLKIQKKLGKMTSSDGTVSKGGNFIIFLRLFLAGSVERASFFGTVMDGCS